MARLPIANAFAQIRAVVGDNLHIAIYPPQISSIPMHRELEVSPWGVYLGEPAGEAHDIHHADTLARAVDKAIAAYRKAMTPLENREPEYTEVDAVIDSVAEVVPV